MPLGSISKRSVDAPLPLPARTVDSCATTRLPALVREPSQPADRFMSHHTIRGYSALTFSNRNCWLGILRRGSDYA